MVNCQQITTLQYIYYDYALFVFVSIYLEEEEAPKDIQTDAGMT